MTKQPRSSKPIRPPQSVPAPANALRAIEAAAIKDITSARFALDLLDALIGTHSDGVFPRHASCLRPRHDLPPQAAAAAREVIEWALGPNPRLDELMGSRTRVLEGIADLRRKSPFGQRCLQVAGTLREKFPSSQPYSAHDETATFNGVIHVLHNAVGRPLNGLTIRMVQALGPSVIRIVGAGDTIPGRLEVDSAMIWLGFDGYTVEEITWAVAIAPPPEGERIEGVLMNYAETGTEGVVWTLADDECLGRVGLHLIEAGDHLTICDPLGHELWSGTIRCDRRAGWRRYPRNPKYGQPVALGYWVRWTQKGFRPDEWARFFIRPDIDRFRGILKKAATERPTA